MKEISCAWWRGMTVRLEPPELLALKCALGQQLAAARRAAGVGQQQVARKSGYSRPSVAHAEAGRQLLSREFWRIADELLQAGGALLAGYQRVQAAKQDHERRTREAELAQSYAATTALPATTTTDPTRNVGGMAGPIGQDGLASVVTAAGAALAEGVAGPLVYLALLSSAAQAVRAQGEDQLYEQLTKFLHGWADTMRRRELVQLLSWAATTVAASPASDVDTEEQQRLAQAIAVPSRVDAQVIDHVEAMLQSCKRQEDALGPQAVLDTVLAQRQLVRTLLANCPAPLRPRLLSVHSNMSSSVGFYFFDLDDAASAMHYCDQARAVAHEARNTELAIYALCSMSYFACCHGKTHAGLDFAAAAQSLASRTDDVLLQVCVADRLGVAYAFDGQHKEYMAAFERAQLGLASAGQASPDSPAYWYHEGLIVSHQSECLLRLGRQQEAVAKASAGLRLFDNSFVGSLAACTLRLGTAHLQSGEIEEAAQVIGDAALLSTQVRSARKTTEIKNARARMQPWQGTQAVQALDERLAVMGLNCGGY